MDAKVKALPKNFRKIWWLLPVCVAVALLAGLLALRAHRVVYTSRATLLSLKNQYSLVAPPEGYYSVIESYFIAHYFKDVLLSQNVTDKVSQTLAKQGIYLSTDQLTAMTAYTPQYASNLAYIDVTSAEKEFLIPVANAFAEAYCAEANAILRVEYFSVVDWAVHTAPKNEISSAVLMLFFLNLGLAVGFAAVLLGSAHMPRIHSREDMLTLPGVRTVHMIPGKDMT